MSMFYYAPRMQVENACQLDTSGDHLQLSLHHEFVLFVSHTWAIEPATCIGCSLRTGVESAPFHSLSEPLTTNNCSPYH